MATATAYISGTVYCDTYPIQYADVILTRYVMEDEVTSTIPQYHQITDKKGKDSRQDRDLWCTSI